ncbi:site-2 protease family protein [Candidatus Woesearchaeota archaeon]|nr:site-2 protease family protein [Candidatus Woesearchaeota archaeon]
MINIDLIFFIIFAVVLLVVMVFNRKRLKIEKILFPLFYLVLYRTKLGINAMKRISEKYPRLISFLGYLGIVVGFLGMIVVFYGLIKSAILIFTTTNPSAGVDILLPGRQIPGLPRLSFWHWIISIFILAVVHEFSHGVVAKRYGIKIKSSGFAVFSILLPILPAAFVEPDEKILAKKNKKQQLSVFAAGSFSNMLVALLFGLLFFFLLNPVSASLIKAEGVKVIGLQEDYPLYKSGISINEEIIEINNVPVKEVNDFVNIMKNVKPGDKIDIKTNTSSYNVIASIHPEDSSRGYVGVFLSSIKTSTRDDIWWASTFLWLRLTVFWIFIINLFVGLFNLFPLAILDGGRIFYVMLLHFFNNNETKSKTIFKIVNVICIFLLLINFWPRLATYIIKFIGLFV